MFAVSYWNDYTNYKLYITTDQSLYNFQMKLRSIIMGSDLPAANGGAAENTVTNAAVIVAILPFMILYPFLQKYFVKGINIGAVKGNTISQFTCAICLRLFRSGVRSFHLA